MHCCEEIYLWPVWKRICISLSYIFHPEYLSSSNSELSYCTERQCVVWYRIIAVCGSLIDLMSLLKLWCNYGDTFCFNRGYTWRKPVRFSSNLLQTQRDWTLNQHYLHSGYSFLAHFIFQIIHRAHPSLCITTQAVYCFIPFNFYYLRRGREGILTCGEREADEKRQGREETMGREREREKRCPIENKWLVSNRWGASAYTEG